MVTKLIGRVAPVALVAALLLLTFPAQTVFSAPDGPHCIGSGPISLPSDYCGCTWGGVYYRGQAIGNVPVSLTFASQSVYTATQNSEAESFPYYKAIGHDMGAKLNDVMTVTTQTASQTVARSFRARPDGVGEQEVALVIPEQGVWQPWLPAGYARTLATQESMVWAGGSAGLISVDLTRAITTTHTLPWPDPAVVAVVVGGNDHVWAAGPDSLAEYDGDTWQDRALPFTATLRTMNSDPVTGALWVAGWESVNAPGSLAVHTGTWQPVSALSPAITSLATDGEGDVWIGTWGEGVYRHDHAVMDVDSGWTHYTVADGLASDEIYGIAVDSDNVWFATNSYSVNGQPLGGVSRYEFATGTWHTFKPTQGLPTDPTDPSLPAPIYAITTGEDGSVWVGTNANVNGQAMDAMYMLATPELWVQDAAQPGNRIRALAVVDEIVLAAGDNHVAKLDRRVTPGSPPTVQIHTAPLTITLESTLVLTATATDRDEDGGRILGWEWMAVQAGHLCTTADRCVVPGQLLGEGDHQIQVRVQDDEGVWSPVATVAVTVTQPVELPLSSLFLPLVRR